MIVGPDGQPMPAGPSMAPYANPTAALRQRKARLAQHLRGVDPAVAQAAAQHMQKAEQANARTYALARLGQLAQSGLSDNQGDLAGLAAAARTSSDPAAAWRALSQRFMGAFQQAGAQGAEVDPRVWLANRVAAQRRAAAEARMRVRGQ